MEILVLEIKFQNSPDEVKSRSAPLRERVSGLGDWAIESISSNSQGINTEKN